MVFAWPLACLFRIPCKGVTGRTRGQLEVLPGSRKEEQGEKEQVFSEAPQSKDGTEGLMLCTGTFHFAVITHVLCMLLRWFAGRVADFSSWQTCFFTLFFFFFFYTAVRRSTWAVRLPEDKQTCTCSEMSDFFCCFSFHRNKITFWLNQPELLEVVAAACRTFIMEMELF